MTEFFSNGRELFSSVSLHSSSTSVISTTLDSIIFINSSFLAKLSGHLKFNFHNQVHPSKIFENNVFPIVVIKIPNRYYHLRQKNYLKFIQCCRLNVYDRIKRNLRLLFSLRLGFLIHFCK